MENALRPFWRRFFTFNWKLGVFLILIICIPRFALVLNANKTANYSYIGLIMVISAIVPFLFLSKEGRRAIGLTKPKNYLGVWVVFAVGLLYSIMLYVLGDVIYNNSVENWYVYIGKSYNIPSQIAPADRLIMFGAMAITGMIFSPIGEELFFRGIVHSSLARSWGDLKASIVDSLAFALTHISHFGLIFLNHQWKSLIFPTIIWTASMFLVSILFYWSRKKTGSLIGSIICHAAFNLGMIFCIFYLLDR